jgi:putative addiction module killer protein
MPQVLEYLTPTGLSPFGKWFDDLEAVVAARVTVALTRMAAGNFGDHKSVGDGVSECRIDFGPGCRVYYGLDGAEIVILLAGGTKKRQPRDIAEAKARWQDYKARTRGRKGN